MSKYIYLFTFFMLTLTGQSFGQDCRRFHRSKACAVTGIEGFNYYGQSRSGVFEIDSTFSYDLILYGKKDYLITVCTERGFYPVHFKIINTETREVFYDNMEDDYIEWIGFTMDAPQKVSIEATLLASDKDPDNFDDNRACVGVSILWRKAEKLGF